MNIANNLALPRPHPTIEISLGAGLPKLSDGCNINRKTRPYKLFNEFGASYQFKPTFRTLNCHILGSALAGLTGKATYSKISSILKIIGGN
jgi:hypothetical protein